MPAPRKKEKENAMKKLMTMLLATSAMLGTSEKGRKAKGRGNRITPVFSKAVMCGRRLVHGAIVLCVLIFCPLLLCADDIVYYGHIGNAHSLVENDDYLGEILYRLSDDGTQRATVSTPWGNYELLEVVSSSGDVRSGSGLYNCVMRTTAGDELHIELNLDAAWDDDLGITRNTYFMEKSTGIKYLSCNGQRNRFAEGGPALDVLMKSTGVYYLAIDRSEDDPEWEGHDLYQISSSSSADLVLSIFDSGKAKLQGSIDGYYISSETICCVAYDSRWGSRIWVDFVQVIAPGKVAYFEACISQYGDRKCLWPWIDFINVSAFSNSYGPFAPGEKVTLNLGLAGYTAKKLPSGLKLDKKTGAVTGSPKKPGTYEVTFTKKGGETLTATFIVGPMPTISIAMEGDVEKCKVTGASKPGKGYLVGKKVGIAAKAPKGTAFAGWFKNDEPWPSASEYLNSKLKYEMTAESLSLVARFEKEKMSVACPSFTGTLAIGEEVRILIEVVTQSGVKSVKGSKLPSGLKVKKIGDMWAIVGNPKKKGAFAATIKVTAKSGAVEELLIGMTVTDKGAIVLPDWAVGSFYGWEQWIEDGDSPSNLDMDIQGFTVGRSGWLSELHGTEEDGNTWSEAYPSDYLPQKLGEEEYEWGIPSSEKPVSANVCLRKSLVVSKFLYADVEVGKATLDAYFSRRGKPNATQYAEFIQDPWALPVIPRHLPAFDSVDNVLVLNMTSYYGSITARLTFGERGKVSVSWSGPGILATTTETRLMPYDYDDNEDVCHALLPIFGGNAVKYGFSVILDMAIPNPDSARASAIGFSVKARSWQIGYVEGEEGE